MAFLHRQNPPKLMDRDDSCPADEDGRHQFTHEPYCDLCGQPHREYFGQMVTMARGRKKRDE